MISLSLRPTDGRRLTPALAGQFVVLRLRATPDGPPIFRSYSLSGPVSDEQYRISVKVEPHGAAGNYLERKLQADDVVDVSEPRGSFTLRPGDGPVALLSAGIGATQVLAMLHDLAAGATPREVWWLHGARDGKSHSFAAEAKRLLGTLAHGRSRIWYSRPAADDRRGREFDARGRVDVNALDELGVCHNCESGLISGTVSYAPDPLEPPAQGNVLICCARPRADVVIDL